MSGWIPDKHRKKTAVVLLLVGALLLGAGTGAYWSDADASGSNTVEAGTLDLTVDSSGTGTLSLANAKPGDVHQATFDLRNVGSVEADHVEFGLQFAETTPEPTEPSDADLDTELPADATAKMIEVTTFSYGGTDELSSVTDGNGNGIVDLADVQRQVGSLDGLPAPAAGGSDSIALTICVQVASDDDGSFNGTDEDLMADGVDIELRFTLNQHSSQ